ncbi:response regulator transcription factor [Halobacillus sp. ACCC02827]|uniref:response regulator transcription factor n=1 Tax=unclassified Halobacillus TaxID=2636472 RepID=UPI0002A4E1C3|nr:MULTISPECIES: response regulator transcription factor [unclassified Halobacillus]ELK44196.1 two component transcriptional regulator, winged helix family protein [Halobacillus sp. BAB-2008]WJE15691.1 response regulator transcription factor [Halobacillus sp. ACCC02827]
MVQLLVVEDDRNLRKMMGVYLEKQGYSIHQAADGEEALKVLDTFHIDLMISDIMMPRLDGYALTKSLRDADMGMPILLVTAKDRLEDMEQGFLSGTDDYMVKPIQLKELSLRVSALLRRAKISQERKITIGSFVIHYDSLTAEDDGSTYAFPKKEFYLLYKLLSYPNRIFSRQQLMEEIWGLDVEVDERTVDTHIKKLRRKLAEVDAFDITTIRGIGYKVECRK